MRKKLPLLILFFCSILLGQDTQESLVFGNFITPELLYGNLVPANTDFPETKPQKGFLLSFGTFHPPAEEWAYRLNSPKTGVTIGVNDLGNTQNVGYAFSVLPFIEFDLFRKRKKDLHMQVGMGASYFNKRYDASTNPFNQGVTTKVTWSFRMFLYFDILKQERIYWRLGGGYLHHSNGHTQLPNQGFNSFLVSASAQFKYKKKLQTINDPTIAGPAYYTKNSNYFFSFRSGVGLNVLSEERNNKEEVYTIALSAGKVINSTYKIGVGLYYRFYEHYYDYIEENKDLIPEFYPEYAEHPFRYATNFAAFVSGELLLNHIGIELNLGYNFYKPAYDFDWQLNEGFTYTEDFGNGPITFVELGDLESTKFKLKKRISSRLGLKYYFFGTASKPVHNVYIGAHLNSNLGRADFSELSLGYVYSFSFE